MYCPECGNKCDLIVNEHCPIYRCLSDGFWRSTPREYGGNLYTHIASIHGYQAYCEGETGPTVLTLEAWLICL